MMTSGTKVRMRSGTIGPAHDPYGYDVLTVTRNGVEHILTTCGLRGVKYERFKLGKDVVWGNVVMEAGGVDWDLAGGAEAAFTEATGAAPWKWEEWYHERIYVEDPMGNLAMYV